MLINDNVDEEAFDQIFGKQMDFDEQSKFFNLFINTKSVIYTILVCFL